MESRWGINYSIAEYKASANELDPLRHPLSVGFVEEKKFDDAPAEKRRLQRNEWSGVLLRIRNNAIIVLGIICLQLPFELAYAHLYEKTETEALRYVTDSPGLSVVPYNNKICADDLLASSIPS